MNQVTLNQGSLPLTNPSIIGKNCKIDESARLVLMQA